MNKKEITRNTSICVRLTQEERAKLEHIVKYSNSSIASVVRALIQDHRILEIEE